MAVQRGRVLRHDQWLVGFQFASLRVEEEADLPAQVDEMWIGDQKVGWWRCLCVCGEELVAHTETLFEFSANPMSRAAGHWGCSRVVALGVRVGRLTVLADAPANVQRRRMYSAQCECGEMLVVPGTDLFRGKKTACVACAGGRPLKPYNPPTKLKPGDRYGRLTIIEEAGREPNSRHKVFKVRCDCGNETVARGAYLVNGNTKSCGCITTENLGRVRELAVRQKTEDRRRRREDFATKQREAYDAIWGRSSGGGAGGVEGS